MSADLFAESVRAEESLGQGRSGFSFLLFMVLSFFAIIYAVILASIFWYMLYVARSNLIFVMAAQSLFLVLVLVVGMKAALASKEGTLNFYSFMLLMAVIMQFSIAMLVAVRGDEMINFFESSARAAQTQLCEDLGYDLNNTLAVAAAQEAMPSNATVPDLAADVERLCYCTGQSVTCIKTYLQERYNVQPSDYQIGQLGAILVQLILAKLAWGMIVDLDVKEEKKRQKQKGGPPKGLLRGTVVAGNDLLDSKSKRGRDPKCTVELLTPDTAVQKHQHQKRETGVLIDTLDPQWDTDFGHIVAYEGSRKLKIEVLDMTKNKKKGDLMGSAIVPLNGPNLDRGGVEVMDGETIFTVDLSFTPPKKRKKEVKAVPAGSVELRLVYVPVSGSAEKLAKSVTSSWYFEAIVLFMVAVSMTILALQSPAEPPDDDLRGTLSMLEIFVATHMTVELALEVVCLVANGKDQIKKHLLDPWMLLALYVAWCNWFSIFNFYGVQVYDVGPWGKIFSVSRIFRIVRPIRTLRLIRHIDIIVRIISTSMGVLLTVCVLLLFLLLLYSLIGMSCFSGAIQYTCLETQLVRSDGGDDFVTASSWPLGCDGDCDVFLPNDLIERGILVDAQVLTTSCPATLECAAKANEVLDRADDATVRCIHLGTGWCDDSFATNATGAEMEFCERLITQPEVANDEFGFQDFDDIGRAVITMFVQMTGDGGMHSMPEALYVSGSSSSGTAWVIFFSASVFLNLLALNLFLAVCCQAYSDINVEMRELDEREEAARKLRQEAIQRDETDEERAEREAKEAENKIPLDERVAAKDWVAEGASIAGCRMSCKALVTSEPFDMTISAIIVLNTATMAFNQQGMSSQTENIIMVVEASFLCVFILEFLVKVAGLGSKLYFAHASNKFDFCVVSICCLGYLALFFQAEIMDMFGGQGEGSEGMQAFRAVRLLRALQLARLLHKQKALMVVLKTIFAAWKPIVLHSFFCCFSISMFAVMGMHLLGGSLGCRSGIADAQDGLCPEGDLAPLYECPMCSLCTEPGCGPRDCEVLGGAPPEGFCRPAAAGDYPYENFETFSAGVLTCFELTVGEEWSHVMYWYMDARDARESAASKAVVWFFFLAQYLWMNCILFSLFIAMLLENFNLKEEEKLPIQKKVWERRKRKALKHWRAGRGSLMVMTLDGDKNKTQAAGTETGMRERLKHAAAVADLEDAKNKSLYLFTLTHPLRLQCAGLQSHPLFSNVILALIMISCISLAVEGPADGYVMQNFGWFFNSINVVVLGAFVFEAALKVIIHGFAYKSGPSTPYLQSKMNRVDFIIIVLCTIAYLPFVGDFMKGGWAKALRVVRVMTPLVNLTKNPEILLVVMSFLRAIPDTIVVTLPLFLMFVVFGVVAQEWFGGSLGECQTKCAVEGDHMHDTCTTSADVTSLNVAEAQLSDLTDLTSCIEVGATWISPSFSFDNTAVGIATLFVTLADGVHEMMVETVEAMGGGFAILFWIAFHMVFTCFFLNLFIGVLSASFSKSKGTATQTSRQRQWNAVKAAIQSYEPTLTDLEDNRPLATDTILGQQVPVWFFHFRLWMFRAATNERLESLWRLVIIANTMTLATDKFPASAFQKDAVTWVNLVCLVLCTVEVAVKLCGFGLTFFRSGWLLSDFILVSVSWGLRLGNVRSGVEALRVVRVFRLIALASKMPTLVKLIESLVNCLRASLALIAICLVIVYLYCVIGMNLFGSVAHTADMESFNDYNNFDNFISGCALLIQVVFGQEISGFVTDLTESSTPELPVSFWLVFIYFATYYIVIIWVCMNLLLVSILDTFAEETADTDADGTRQEDFDGFAHCWSSLTLGCHMVPATQPTQSFASRLAHKAGAALHLEDEKAEDPDTIPEDGDKFLCGTLSMTIQHIGGLSNDFIEPWCKVQTQGQDVTKLHTPVAHVVKDGKASFVDPENEWSTYQDVKDPVTKSKGATLAFNFNERHTGITIQVNDDHQFLDEMIGRVTITREELQAMTEPKTQTLMLKRRAEAEPGSPRAEPGPKDHWSRFETDKVYSSEIVDQFGYLDDDDPTSPRTDGTVSPRSPTRASPRKGRLSPRAGSPDSARASPSSPQDANGGKQAQLEPEPEPEPEPQAGGGATVQSASGADAPELTKAERKAQKKAKKARAKADKKKLKAEKKAEKKRLKDLKKEEKRRKKLGLPALSELKDDADAEGDEPEIKVEWVDSGVEVKVTFVFEQMNQYEPKRGFLGDFTNEYPQKEQNCSVEGWLDAAVGGQSFQRHFVYMQQEPEPCLKIVQEVQSLDQLQQFAAAGKVKTVCIPGDRIMNIFSSLMYREEHERHRKGVKNDSHEDCEFQIGVDHIVEGKKAELPVAHLSGTISGCKDLLNVAKGKSETSDPYCVVTLISTGALARDAGDGEVVHKTETIDDNLNPQWDFDFSFEVLVSSATLRIEVFDKRVKKDLLMGRAELQIGAGGIPGPTLTSRALVKSDSDLEVPLATRGEATVELDENVHVGVQVQLQMSDAMEKDREAQRAKMAKARDKDRARAEKEKAKKEKQEQKQKEKQTKKDGAAAETDVGSSTADASGGSIPSPEDGDDPALDGPVDISAGLLDMELRYVSLVPAKRIKQLKERTDDGTVRSTEDEVLKNSDKKQAAERLALLRESELAVDAVARVDYRFRALSPDNQTAWINAVRWLANGCPAVPESKYIPHAELTPNELTRAQNNISLMDLPMGRLTRLIQGLHVRKAVGGHMPTRRWVAYAVFNIETHAMAETKKSIAKKQSKRREYNGLYLSDARGLSFHNVLERLTLLHLGKEKSLSYEQQATEYETELNKVRVACFPGR